MSSEGLHEPAELLSKETRELHRALTSLIEELEAVDWYGQRVDACEDPDLQAILRHNRDEEKEHACMTLEWIRRHDPEFDAYLRKFLFCNGNPVEAGDHGHGSEPQGAAERSLGIGSLRGGAAS